MTSIIVIVSAVLIVAVVWHLWAARCFLAQFDEMNCRLRELPSSDAPPTPAVTLPVAVRQLIENTDIATTKPPQTISLTQDAEMRMGPDQPWQKIQCKQVIAIREPGFVWLADQKRGPVSAIRVVDAYVDGHGLLEARLLGSIRVARFDGPKADQSELMRYLAEIPWAPDAVLHNPSITWHQVDGRTVELTAESDGGIARVRLLYNDDGDVVEMHADERGSTENGQIVMRPWRGRFSDYREFSGRRIPTYGEVGYIYDDGYAAYWRGRITDYTLN